MYKHQHRTGLTEQDAELQGLKVISPCEAAHQYLAKSLELGEGHPDYDFAVEHLQECERCREALREMDPDEIDREAAQSFLEIVQDIGLLGKLQ